MAKRRKFSTADKESVAQRALGICEYCQMPEDFSTDTFEMEHITALANDGTNENDSIIIYLLLPSLYANYLITLFQ
jgi:hypothetical protein